MRLRADLCGPLRLRLIVLKRQLDKAFARVRERFREMPEKGSIRLKILGLERGCGFDSRPRH